MSDNNSTRFVSRLTRDTLALILAGGRGSRLKQLTDWRAKPAVPFGGKFRIIDFPLSNCVNSGIRRVGILTQYKAHSLLRHVQQGWGFMRGALGEFVELLPASQRNEQGWYSGTADAVYQNIDILRNHGPEYVLILAGDHIYKMDYGDMLAEHVAQNADMTIGCIEVPIDEAKALGVMSVDVNRRIVAFDEKPEEPTPMPGRDDVALGSMGIYVFNAAFLYEQLIKDADTKDSSHDFGHDIIPNLIKNYKVVAFPYRDVQGNEPGYWRDVGTVDAFWTANLELIGVTPELNLYHDEWPIWTHQAQLPPAKFVFDDEDRRGMAVDSMVSGGCIISGAVVRHSVLFSNVEVDSYSLVEDSVVLPDVTIGCHCRLKKVILDKGCVVPEGTVIGEDLEQDAKRYHVSAKGVVLVTPEMLGQNYRYVR
ncbi:glucose-1-phosphate adenylyltransferase [Methylophaga sp. OBS4]|uniref:glucose-1-phosphate adenylyltransferase n=1 Tax=Methylophaga sp. OBS4 TaxID=2991935 RepID=UPI002254FF1E|nr:glucose-1-phosphate adenylyltransferase [Methylophaga sp. OBS4]MCX4186811.1 glucose-1-phosphate adenylyltransferase [Methylophaga sp. OBS4]